MSILQTLKLAVKPQISVKPELFLRQKLIMRLQEQLQMAQATLDGGTYHRMRWVSITSPDGTSQRQQRAVRVRPWWIKDAAGSILMTVRYGKKTMELRKGLDAIHVGQLITLPEVISQLLKATEAGELDAQLVAMAADNPFSRSVKPTIKLGLKRG